MVIRIILVQSLFIPRCLHYGLGAVSPSTDAVASASSSSSEKYEVMRAMVSNCKVKRNQDAWLGWGIPLIRKTYNYTGAFINSVSSREHIRRDMDIHLMFSTENELLEYSQEQSDLCHQLPHVYLWSYEVPLPESKLAIRPKKFYLLYLMKLLDTYKYFVVTDGEVLCVADVDDLFSRFNCWFARRTFYGSYHIGSRDNPLTTKRHSIRSGNTEAYRFLAKHNVALAKIKEETHNFQLDTWYTDLAIYENSTTHHFLSTIGYVPPPTTLTKASAPSNRQYSLQSIQGSCDYTSYQYFCIALYDWKIVGYVNQSFSSLTANFQMRLGAIPLPLQVHVLQETQALWAPASISQCLSTKLVPSTNIVFAFHTDRCNAIFSNLDNLAPDNLNCLSDHCALTNYIAVHRVQNHVPAQ